MVYIVKLIVDRYFLRSQSSKLDEVQRQVENDSSKDINNTATEVEEEAIRRDAADTEMNRPVRERKMEQTARQQIATKTGSQSIEICQ